MNKSDEEPPLRMTLRLQASHVGEAGNVSGIAHVIRTEGELDKFREGEILVAETISGGWQLPLELARAVLFCDVDADTDEREMVLAYGRPILRINRDCWQNLRSGDILNIDANGVIVQQLERRQPDSPMRVAVPAARAARLMLQTHELTSTDVLLMPSPMDRAINPDDFLHEADQNGDDTTGGGTTA